MGNDYSDEAFAANILQGITEGFVKAQEFNERRRMHEEELGVKREIIAHERAAAEEKAAASQKKFIIGEVNKFERAKIMAGVKREGIASTSERGLADDLLKVTQDLKKEDTQIPLLFQQKDEAVTRGDLDEANRLDAQIKARQSARDALFQQKTTLERKTGVTPQAQTPKPQPKGKGYWTQRIGSVSDGPTLSREIGEIKKSVDNGEITDEEAAAIIRMKRDQLSGARK